MSPAALAAPLLVFGVLGGLLNGCASSFAPDRAENRYSDYTQFTAEAGDAFADATWVPADATRLASVSQRDGEGRMLAFQSPTGVDAALCPAGPLTGEPAFETNWWPSAEPVDGLVCGEWQVFAAGAGWYGWAE